MALSIKDTTRIAKLAKLTLTEPELETMSKQLGDVVSYIDELSQLNTDGIEPTSQTTGLENVTRKDKKRESLSQNEATKEAPNVHNSYFFVPMILEERTV